MKWEDYQKNAKRIMALGVAGTFTIEETIEELKKIAISYYRKVAEESDDKIERVSAIAHLQHLL